jgi:hypothetical protein
LVGFAPWVGLRRWSVFVVARWLGRDANERDSVLRVRSQFIQPER